MQKGNVYRNGECIGEISRDDEGKYTFVYHPEYLTGENALSISVNLPLRQEPFVSNRLFSFFFNMLAEGNMKEIQCQKLKIDPDDGFTQLLKTAHSNTIGSVTVKEV